MMPAPSRMLKLRAPFEIIPNTYLSKPLPLVKASFTQARIETVSTICFIVYVVIQAQNNISYNHLLYHYLPTHIHMHMCAHMYVHTHKFHTKIKP